MADGRDLDDTRINQLHLGRLVVVHPGTSVAEAAEKMLALSLQHLPVIDGRLVGLVDTAGVCRALLAQGRPSWPGPAPVPGQRCRGSTTRARVTPSAEVRVRVPLCRWATTASDVARPRPVPWPIGFVV